MDKCNYEPMINAYHDGELDDDDTLIVEEHLAECPACRGQLGQIRQISRAFTAAFIPEVPASSIERFHEALDHVGERIILRFAAINAVAAAIILTVCSLLLVSQIREETGLEPAEWESAAVTIGSDVQQEGAELRLSQWFIRELGGENGNGRN